jgi:hypothetical protein
VSSSRNRASIAGHGLDWRRMTITTGVALRPVRGRPPEPELDAVFLCDSLDDVEFFVGFGQHPLVDVWEVDVTGLAVDPAPDGWRMSRAPIAPDRVRLVQADRTPEPRELCSVWLSFVTTGASVEAMSALAGLAPDRAGEDDGDDLGREPGVRYAWWVLEGSDRYAPLPGQAGELLGRIAAAESGLARLAAACAEVCFGARAASGSWGLDGGSAALLERVGATVEISVGGP